MKKCVALTAAVLATLMLAACGGSSSAPASSASTMAAGKAKAEQEKSASAGQETADKKAGASGARKIEDPEGYEYSFGDDAVLLDTENVHINARKLFYKDGKLIFGANLRDKTGNILYGEQYWVNGGNVKKSGFKSDAGKDDGFRLADVEDWNQMIGETEDCFLGTFYLFIRKGKRDGEIIERVKFDTYLSEKTPFVNIVSGDIVQVPEDVKAKAEEQEANEAGEKVKEESDKPGQQTSEDGSITAGAENESTEAENESMAGTVDAALAGTWMHGKYTSFTFADGKVTRVSGSTVTEGTYEIREQTSSIRVTLNENSGGTTSFYLKYTIQDGEVTILGDKGFIKQ